MAGPAGDYGLREHIGIAVDGGGVRGAIVAHGIIELENILGARPLIDDPRVKVLAGTSTGSLIAAGLALGLTGEEILALYTQLGKRAFSQAGTLRPFGARIPLLSRARLPIGTVRALEKLPLSIGEVLLYLLMPARYSFDPLRAIIRETLAKHAVLGADPTLAEVGAYLQAKPNRPTLIITAVEVGARQTRFLKTTPSETYGQMKLADALLASSCIPTYFDPIPIPPPPGARPTRWLVDGGVGNFGNPALVVAWEMCEPLSQARGYDPAQVTLYSFGTGYVPTEIYDRAYGMAPRWWALDWAIRATDLFVDDTIREQARNLVAQYRGIDLRRFQVLLDRVVDPDRFDLLDGYLMQKGEQLRRLVRQNRHALRPPDEVDQRHDPEQIVSAPLEGLLR